MACRGGIASSTAVHRADLDLENGDEIKCLLRSALRRHAAKKPKLWNNFSLSCLKLKEAKCFFFFLTK